MAGIATYIMSSLSVALGRTALPGRPCVATKNSGRLEWFSIVAGSASESART